MIPDEIVMKYLTEAQVEELSEDEQQALTLKIWCKDDEDRANQVNH